MDKKVVEDRLTCRESVITGHTAVLRVATRLNAFVSALAAAAGNGSSSSGAEMVAAHDALVKELMLMRLEVRGFCGLGGGWGRRGRGVRASDADVHRGVYYVYM